MYILYEEQPDDRGEILCVKACALSVVLVHCNGFHKITGCLVFFFFKFVIDTHVQSFAL